MCFKTFRFYNKYIKNKDRKSYMDWKKIGVVAFLILVGGFLYLYLGIFAGSYLWLISVLLHLVLSIFFVLKNYNKTIIGIIAFLLLLQVFIAYTPFPKCDQHFKGGWTTACDCIGLKKIGILESQCMGMRDKCYKFSEGDTIQWTRITFNEVDDKKIEVSCKEIDER